MLIYRKYKVFRERKFFSSKFDFTWQIIWILIGLAVSFVIVYNWIPDSYLHWIFLLGGVAGIISGIFYEKTIQFYQKNGLLIIEYGSKGKHELNSIDFFELKDGIVKITSGERRIEIYDLSIEKENTTKLLKYLSDFQNKIQKEER